MASWFDSAAQSIGNFVSGHGFEDNKQRSIIDAQNEKKKKEEQQASLNRQVTQQKTVSQPQTPNSLLSIPSINNPSTQFTDQPSTQQSTQLTQKPTAQNNSNLTGAPVTPNATINKPVTPQVQVQPEKSNIFQKVGSFITGIGPTLNKVNTDASNAVNRFINGPSETELRSKRLDYSSIDPKTLISKYNSSDSNSQRDIKNTLEGTIKDYNLSSDPILRKASQNAQNDLQVLNSSKENLSKYGLPEVNSKFNLLNTISDIGKAIAVEPFRYTKNLLTAAKQDLFSESPYDQIDQQLKSGKISQQDYEIQKSQINNGLSELTGSLTGQDKGSLDRFLRSAGYGAEGASFALGGLMSPATSLPSLATNAGAMGSATGLSALQSGTDTTTGQVALSFAAGSLGTLLFQGISKLLTDRSNLKLANNELNKMGMDAQTYYNLQTAINNNDTAAFRTAAKNVTNPQYYDTFIKMADGQDIINAASVRTSTSSTPTPTLSSLGTSTSLGLPAASQTMSSPSINAVIPTSSTLTNGVAPQVTKTIPDKQTRAFALLDGDFEGAGFTNHHGLWVDNAISSDFTNKITPELASKLKSQGITMVEKTSTKTGIEYGNTRIGNDNHGVIRISDENQFKSTTSLDFITLHESGHHIWTQKMSQQDKLDFAKLNPKKSASQISHEQAGNVGLEMEGESFSDYVAMELQGEGNQIPKEVRPIVQKYVKSDAAPQVTKTGITLIPDSVVKQDIAESIDMGGIKIVDRAKTIENSMAHYNKHRPEMESAKTVDELVKAYKSSYDDSNMGLYDSSSLEQLYFKKLKMLEGRDFSSSSKIQPAAQPKVVAPQVTTSPITAPQLSLPENTSTTPTINNVLKSDGANGFVTKTPEQVVTTQNAINSIKKIDSKLNIIRQGKTNSLDSSEVRSLMKQRSELLSVITGDKPLQDPTIKTPAQVTNAGTADLGNPGAAPTDGVITSNPTNTDITNIIENTQNPTAPKTPKAKLTPQNEMGDITQKQMDNFTGELGVNKNGQIYRKVDQATAKDTAMKNLLDGKTPEEYLATAAQTGQADSAELAILMQQVPKDSPIWAELASLKGKLGTQKGQALALLEKTMRETATSGQLSDRILEKAATAEFDTTKIAKPIEQINKNFTDARDAYNSLLQTSHTRQELRDAKNAMDFASRKSFIDIEKLLNDMAKNKVQHDLAFDIGKKANLYTPTSAGSSLLSGPPTLIKNTFQGFSSPAYQATTGALEGKINQVIGGSRIGTFDTKGFKQGLKQGFSEWKANNALRSNQLGLTKNPTTWAKHPVNSIRNVVGAATDFGNIGMEAGAQAGLRSHYTKLLQEQGYTGEKLIKAVDDNIITDPLNLYDTYIKDMNDLNGLTSNSDRNGQIASVRKVLSNWISKTGVTNKTANTIADYIEKAVVPFVKPAAVIGKKGINMATGGLSDNLIPLIQAGRRGDTVAVKNSISKILSTIATTTAGGAVVGYGLAKANILTQDQYGGWKIGDVPISGYAGAYVVPLAIGALIAQIQNGDIKLEDYGSKFGLTLMNTLPYGDIAQNVSNLTSGISGAIGLAEGKGGQSGYDLQNAISTFGANLAKERIPASAFLNFTTKIIGGNVKDTNSDNKNPIIGGIESATNKVISGIPVLGNSDILPDKKNSFGDVIQKPNAISTILGATNPSISESDKSTGITAVGSNNLNKVAKTNLTTTEDKDAYNTIVKRLEDNGDSVTDSNVAKEFVKDGKPLLASKYDSSINTSIDDDDKIALAKYNTLDADHQAVYVQDQQKALDTYTAQLNNKEANGTLSDDDKKTYKVWSGSGNSLLINALVAKTNVDNNIPTETINLYEQVTTQKEYDKLSSDQRAKLDEYAAALQKNGVKVRSFLLGGDSSSKKGASNVPLTKAVTSGGGGSGKFAHQDINVDIPQVVKPAPQYVIKQRKISVG